MKKRGMIFVNAPSSHRSSSLMLSQSRGQVSAYVIIALIIVVFAIVLYYLYPRLSTVFSGDAEPNSFMRTCIEPELDSAVDLLSRQGGYANPQGSIMFEGENIKYLCYTTQYYQPCYVQQPLLVQHVEQEIATLIQTKARSCIRELRDQYTARGYEVTGGDAVAVNVDVALKSINVVVEAPMTFTKESTQSFQTFRFNKPSRWYGLLMTAVSIIDFESTYGDSETTIYMRYYPELQLRKTKLIDGSKVYTVRNVETNEQFTFASRSLAWPGGLGLTA